MRTSEDSRSAFGIPIEWMLIICQAAFGSFFDLVGSLTATFFLGSFERR